ncbi:response regulator receiver domain protein [Calothrix parasitica NIES-267]|uniref:Response regulator receiver domain protein n=1 Tax=Calothrix parasitica NIES-267 TaxID=1973488 RepID=A0A1Z4LSD6_9CYAN|nr:response regulator receiver domain protein [Calothrix parasitica NIES-267]
MITINSKDANNLSLEASLKILLVDEANDIFMSEAIELLNSQYSDIKVLIAQTADIAIHQIKLFEPDLVIMDLMVSKKPGFRAKISTGIQFLLYIINNHPETNIFVCSEYIETLQRIEAKIKVYHKGFVAARKGLSNTEMMQRVNWSLQGLTHLKEIYKNIHTNKFQSQLKPEWQRMLNLAFREGLQDKVIAENIRVSERMVRNYWNGVQEVLGIDSGKLKRQGKNIRIVTLNRAREAGLID